MDKSTIAKIIQETTDEVLSKNSPMLEGQLDKTIELAVQLSCLTNLKILQKLGIIDTFTE
ncbi:hypothetical protein [Clostridium tunisiense]|uniref:hypothetical protein n=1 Tax=Clostridium tunisiense TaxID=219748 RepID=UPI0002DA6587|nr:hypothetical protein [Clostridium tunisiense]